LMPASCAFASLCHSSLPVVSRSFTGMTRGIELVLPLLFLRHMCLCLFVVTSR
jgi:hypothetical protein